MLGTHREPCEASLIPQAAYVVGNILKCREITHYSCALLQALNWSRPFLDLLTGLGAKISVFKVLNRSVQSGACRAARLSQGKEERAVSSPPQAPGAPLHGTGAFPAAAAPSHFAQAKGNI